MHQARADFEVQHHPRLRFHPQAVGVRHRIPRELGESRLPRALLVFRYNDVGHVHAQGLGPRIPQDLGDRFIARSEVPLEVVGVDDVARVLNDLAVGSVALQQGLDQAGARTHLVKYTKPRGLSLVGTRYGNGLHRDSCPILVTLMQLLLLARELHFGAEAVFLAGIGQGGEFKRLQACNRVAIELGGGIVGRQDPQASLVDDQGWDTQAVDGSAGEWRPPILWHCACLALGFRGRLTFRLFFWCFLGL